MTTPTSPASGAAPLQTPGETPHHTTAYRPGTLTTALAITAACLLAASATAVAVLVFPASHQYIEAHDTGNTYFAKDYRTAYVAASAFTAFLLLLAYVVTCVWLWRARGNAEFLAPEAPQPFRRGWVWGSWVVPIAFLWFPFNVVRDVAGATRDTIPIGEPAAPGRTARPSHRVLGLWWGFWLAYVVIAQVASRITPWDASPGPSVARALVWLEVLDAAAGLVALVFWIEILRGIHRSQEARRAELHPAVAVDAPPGVHRAGAGALWAVMLVPLTSAAVFVILGVLVTAGAVLEVVDPDLPAAAHRVTGSAPADQGDEGVDLRALEVGDCISTKLTEGPIPDSVAVVDCDTRHAHEVFGAFDLPAGPYPGERAVTAEVEKRCRSLFRYYVGVGYERSELDFMYLYPLDRERWATDRGASCLIAGPETGSSYRGSRR